MRASSRANSFRLGFVPCAGVSSLLIAEELGMFRRHGVELVLLPFRSWSALREGFASGELEAAELLAPMPLLEAIGAGAERGSAIVGATLALNGGTITLSERLMVEVEAAAPQVACRRPLPAAAFAGVLARRREAGLPPFRLAVVHPASPYHYLLRYWLISGGISPDRDLRILTLSLPNLTATLARRRIDGFCAAEPWGSLAVAEGQGRIALATSEIWPNHPDRVLAFSATAARNRDYTTSVVAALIEAGCWMDRPENRDAAARILCERVFKDVPLQLMVQVLSGRLAMRPGESAQATRPLRFHVAGASCPVTDHAAWWFRQMQLWGHVPADIHVAPVARIWRPSLWMQALGRVHVEAEQSATLPAWMAVEAQRAGAGVGA
jgi:two-component system, oxyanion-binding sensor